MEVLVFYKMQLRKCVIFFPLKIEDFSILIFSFSMLTELPIFFNVEKNELKKKAFCAVWKEGLVKRVSNITKDCSQY